MKEFKIVEKNGEKKYKIVDVAEALGVSNGALTGFMSARCGSAKDGMSISQIVEYINIPHRNRQKDSADPKEVASILGELRQRGIVVVEDEQLKF